MNRTHCTTLMKVNPRVGLNFHPADVSLWKKAKGLWGGETVKIYSDKRDALTDPLHVVASLKLSTSSHRRFNGFCSYPRMVLISMDFAFIRRTIASLVSKYFCVVITSWLAQSPNAALADQDRT